MSSEPITLRTVASETRSRRRQSTPSIENVGEQDYNCVSPPYKNKYSEKRQTFHCIFFFCWYLRLISLDKSNVKIIIISKLFAQFLNLYVPLPQIKISSNGALTLNIYFYKPSAVHFSKFEITLRIIQIVCYRYQ